MADCSPPRGRGGATTKTMTHDDHDACSVVWIDLQLVLERLVWIIVFQPGPSDFQPGPSNVQGQNLFLFFHGKLPCPASQPDDDPSSSSSSNHGGNFDGVSMNIINDDFSSCVMVLVVATTNAFGNGPECAENAPAAGGTGCGTVRVCVCVAVTSRWARYGTIRVTPRGGEGPCTACRHPRAGWDDRTGAGWTIPHSNLVLGGYCV